ncbi:glycoside hydrolase family 16 protein [Novosphingobium rosa]|uniref:glycoside hydrolase family 16 protein n=1 Tax=Novosphingobium rosa TaxID=76978 RepID=UPI000A02CD19|nr:glycoside hydrolase family 16 protein [Novosphingobium rosa]
MMPRSVTRAVALLATAPFLLSGNIAYSAPSPPLDLSHYSLTFEENFDDLSVSPRGDGHSRWIAHTPWSGDFGDAVFADPEPGFPFTIKDGVLRIEARKNASGRWFSGLLSAVDSKDRGFCQQYGYFEARMKLPPGPGVWPSFWLIGRDKSKGSAEIDVMEYYGRDNSQFISTWHVWKSQLGQPDEGGRTIIAVPSGSLSTQFHTYGAEVTPTEVRFYLDRVERWRVPAPPSYSSCFYPLVDLALGSGWPIKDTPDPSMLWVDYIHVYQRKSD